MEKYGFVYIWFDRKHKRYYIGCHWGYEDDDYICSSTWMRNSYIRRPQDFKRRILSRIYTSRQDTFIKEQEWLNLIKKEEIRIRYYNLQIKSGPPPNHKGKKRTIEKPKECLHKLKGDNRTLKQKEHSKKLAELQKGKPLWNKGKSGEYTIKGKTVIVDGVNYKSYIEAARQLNKTQASFSQSIKYHNTNIFYIDQNNELKPVNKPRKQKQGKSVIIDEIKYNSYKDVMLSFNITRSQFNWLVKTGKANYEY